MKTPVRIALILSFCGFIFSGWSQLHYDRPVSFAPLPFPYEKSTTFWLPGCAVLTKKPGMSDFELYKASHPPLIDFTYREALAPRPIVKMEARHCLGDVYYVRVFDSPIGGNIPASVRRKLENTSCWIPVAEAEEGFRYTPIISTIAPSMPSGGEE